jgi:hypothetical protein
LKPKAPGPGLICQEYFSIFKGGYCGNIVVFLKNGNEYGIEEPRDPDEPGFPLCPNNPREMFSLLRFNAFNN